MSFEIFLYPFCDPDWVITNILRKHATSRGKYAVTCVLRIFYTQDELIYCLGDFYPESSIFVLFSYSLEVQFSSGELFSRQVLLAIVQLSLEHVLSSSGPVDFNY